MGLIKETRVGYGVTGRPETPGKANAQFRRRSKAGSDKTQWDFWVIFYKCEDNNGNGWICLLTLNLTYPRCIDSAASHLEGMGLEGVDIQVLVGDVTHWWMMGDNSSKLTCFIFCLNSNKLLCRLMMYWWDSTTTAQSEQLVFSPWKKILNFELSRYIEEVLEGDKAFVETFKFVQSQIWQDMLARVITWFNKLKTFKDALVYALIKPFTLENPSSKNQ